MRRHPFVTGAIAVLLVESTMLLLDMGPEPLLVAAVVAVAGCAIWCLSTLSGTASFIEPLADAPAPSVGADWRVTRLRSAVWSLGEEGASTRLHSTLVDLIDDQLEHAHGVTRRGDPEAAMRIMGPELQAFSERPDAARSLSRTAELDRNVSMIDRL